MGVQLANHLMELMPEFRVAPTTKRIRARLGGQQVLDTTDALLVWEPHRIVPVYAVPQDDLTATLSVAEPPPPEPGRIPPVLGPEKFALHTSPGQSFTVSAGGQVRPSAAFAPTDPAAGGRICLDFTAFDAWLEEDEPAIGHPHDPFHRIDILPSSRHVTVTLDGVQLADSRRPTALYETSLPVRWYLPPEDVRTDLMEPSQTHTVCAYKGTASYHSYDGAAGAEAGTDLAWTYPGPLPEASRVAGLICFFSERVDITVDGELQPRPQTPWSRSEPEADQPEP